MSNYLVACAAHVGHHAGHNSKSLGGRYFCPKHLAELFAGFDPQRNDTVRYIDGPQWPYAVLGRAGDTVTLRRLGQPDAKVFPESVHQLWPDSRQPSFSVGCGTETLSEPGTYRVRGW